jgi:hypothetical protein
MKRAAFVAFLFATLALDVGCMGAIRSNSARRTAKKEFIKTCTDKEMKFELVREIDDSDFDYLAEVRATGCGKVQMYICGQQRADWACKAE